MFDKNNFKDTFKKWTETNPFANLDEVQKICELYIPPEYRETYSWLVDESTSWFFWKQDLLKNEILNNSEVMKYNN